jgi:hypothetical protein
MSDLKYNNKNAGSIIRFPVTQTAKTPSMTPINPSQQDYSYKCNDNPANKPVREEVRGAKDEIREQETHPRNEMRT